MSDLLISLGVIGVYLLIFVVIGAYEARGGVSRDPVDFFLAGRGLGLFVLVFTIFATIQSGWSYFGGPGFAYGTGFGIIAVAIGNIFIILFGYLIGLRLWKMGSEHDLLSPVEFMQKRTESDAAALVLLVALLIFVLPYIAIQPMVGGIIFNVLTEGMISTSMGALITIAVMTAYVLVAGMRGVAWTDTIQGVLMLVFLLAGLIALVFAEFGSFADFGGAIAENPDLYSTPGPVGFWTPWEILGWVLMTAFATVMFPQVLVRYMAAESPLTLKRTMVLYGVISAVYFGILAYVGATGALAYPGLENPDDIYVTIILDVFGIVVASIILGGVLSAMISTADSQLLVASQLLVRDGYSAYINPDPGAQRETRVGRLIIILLAMIAGVLALTEPESIFLLAELFLFGFAVTAIPFIASLYWTRVTSWGIISSIVVGEAFVFAFAFDVIPPELFAPVHQVVVILAIVLVLVVGVSYLTDPPSDEAIEKYGRV